VVGIEDVFSDSQRLKNLSAYRRCVHTHTHK
jgi:hypothetical protein